MDVQSLNFLRWHERVQHTAWAAVEERQMTLLYLTHNGLCGGSVGSPAASDLLTYGFEIPPTLCVKFLAVFVWVFQSPFPS